MNLWVTPKKRLADLSSVQFNQLLVDDDRVCYVTQCRPWTRAKCFMNLQVIDKCTQPGVVGSWPCSSWMPFVRSFDRSALGYTIPKFICNSMSSQGVLYWKFKQIEPLSSSNDLVSLHTGGGAAVVIEMHWPIRVSHSHSCLSVWKWLSKKGTGCIEMTMAQTLSDLRLPFPFPWPFDLEPVLLVVGLLQANHSANVKWVSWSKFKRFDYHSSFFFNGWWSAPSFALTESFTQIMVLS